jgi:hypothetical protein
MEDQGKRIILEKAVGISRKGRKTRQGRKTRKVLDGKLVTPVVGAVSFIRFLPLRALRPLREPLLLDLGL